MSTPWDFEYSFKTCPALVGGTLASCLLNGTPWQWHPAAAAKGPHPMLWEHTTYFVTLVHCWPFSLLYWWYWSIPLFFALQMICAEPGEGLHNFFFKRIFTFFINFIFALQFFFFALTGDSYFVNPASGNKKTIKAFFVIPYLRNIFLQTHWSVWNLHNSKQISDCIF